MFNWSQFSQKIIYDAVTSNKPRLASFRRKANSCLREPISRRNNDSFKIQNFNQKGFEPEAEKMVENLISNTNVYSSERSNYIHKIKKLEPISKQYSGEGDVRIPSLLNNNILRFEKVLSLLESKISDVQMIEGVDINQENEEIDKKRLCDIMNAKIPLASEFYKEKLKKLETKNIMNRHSAKENKVKYRKFINWAFQKYGCERTFEF